MYKQCQTVGQVRISWLTGGAGQRHTAAMKAAFLDWIRAARLQVGEWLFWRRALKGRPVRRRRRRKPA
jgi:hypothetical protein